MLSLPHTPHAEEPLDSPPCRCTRSTGPAAVTVTTLNSCSGARSVSVQYATPASWVGGDESLVHDPAGGQLEVVAGRAHGHPRASGGRSRPRQPELERLLGSDDVLTFLLTGGVVLGDAYARHRADPPRQVRHDPQPRHPSGRPRVRVRPGGQRTRTKTMAVPYCGFLMLTLCLPLA